MTASLEDVQSEIMGIRQQVMIATLGRAGVRSGGTIECIRDTLAETKAWPIGEHLGIFAGSAWAEREKAIKEITKVLNESETASGLELTPYIMSAPLPKHAITGEGKPVRSRIRTDPPATMMERLTHLLTALEHACPPRTSDVHHTIGMHSKDKAAKDPELTLALKLHVDANYYRVVFLEEGDLEKPVQQLVDEIELLHRS